MYSKSSSLGGVNCIIAPPAIFSTELTVTLPGGVPSDPFAL